MTSYSPFVQLVFVVMAGAVVILYIQPTILAIREVQENTRVYNTQLANVKDVNDILADHNADINNIPIESRQALDRYLPNTIEPMSIMRDIEALTAEVGVTLVSVDYTDSSAPVAAVAEEGSLPETVLAPDGVLVTVFQLSVETDYMTLKKLLRAIEINNYQLEVTSLEVTPSDTDAVSVKLTLEAYSLAPVQS